MKVYKYVCDSDEFDSVALPRGGYSVLDRLDGTPVGKQWVAPEVSWYSVGQSGDFPRLTGNVPVFTEQAWKALRPLVGKSVERLPLRHKSPSHPPIAATHVLPVLNCLDPDKAKVKYFDGGGILRIEHYAFVEKQIANCPIFRIAGQEGSNAYVTQAFRDAVKAAGLRGLLFTPLP